MFENFLRKTIEKSLKSNNYVFSNFLLETYNKLNIPIDPIIFNEKVKGDKNILNSAILSGNYKAVRTFLANGARLELDVKNTVSPFNLAISKKDINMLRVLIEHISCRSIIQNTSYDKEVAKLLMTKDITGKTPLVKAIDMFLESKDKNDKETLKECMRLIYNNPLFDKNNSEVYNQIWKERSNYFLAYSDRVLDSVENYVMKTQNEELIKFFVDNGLNYVNKAILCVNPKLYSHSGMILKYKEPIKLKDSNNEIAGVLYSYELKARLDNAELSTKEKKTKCSEKVKSFIIPSDALMKRVFLTREDMEKVEVDNDNIYDFANVRSEEISQAVSKAYKTIGKLKRLPPFSKVVLKNLLSELTSDIENVSYLFSIHTKDAYNFIAKEKIVKYDFIYDEPIIEVGDDTNEGYSIYDFIWKAPKQLSLNPKQKIKIIEQFLNKACMRFLKEKKLINDKDNTFTIDDFKKLPTKEPNDLHEKFYYSQTYIFNLDLEPNSSNVRENYKTAMCGFKMQTLLEKYNIDITKYAFFGNNCVTTLKNILTECGYEKEIEKVDKKLNKIRKIHPKSVIKILKEMGTATREFILDNI